jgi:integrase/recombinase XerD
VKLSQAIDVYIQRRRATGAHLRVPEFILRAFLRLCGNVELHRIRRSIVEEFLRGPRPIRSGTVRGRHSALKMFFAYWVLRGRMRRTPLPQNVPKRTDLFVPYIYSHAELRRLLDTADLCQQRLGCKISGATLRALLLLLYGTGMRVGEALALQISDLDLENDVIRIRDAKFYKSRLVPIGQDLHRLLSEYLCSERRMKSADCLFFQSREQKRIRPAAVANTFRSLREMAGVLRTQPSSYQPRIHDLRHTFAVHRVTEWYRQGANVQKLLLALSTYLGHASLEGTQRYLSMTPELLQQANDRFERYVGGGDQCER